MMLVLCLALVCSLSVTAFAQRIHSDREEYDGDITRAVSYAEIDQYSTNGWVDAEGYNDSASTGISVTYSYLSNNGIAVYGEMSDNQGVSTSIGIIYSSGSIRHMRYAQYDFWAQVPSVNQTYDYECTAILEY